jgi:hypothetical protein
MVAVNMMAAEPALPARTAALTAAVPAAGSSSHQAVEMPEGFWYSVKRRVLGPPLVTEQLKNERLSIPLALGVLSCDGLSSDRRPAARRTRLRGMVGIGHGGRPAMINPAYDLLGWPAWSLAC